MPRPNPLRRHAGRIAAVLLAGSALGIPFSIHAHEAPPASGDALRDGFADPPSSARPRVWWHWMNGNVTEDGIAKDLAWMHRIGIGGLQAFDAALNTPQVVDKRLVYMTPEWKHAFRTAAELADGYGMELAIAASPGWSETGGPWVAPKDGLKKLVWSETLVTGGKRFAGMLAQPPGVTGPFQSFPKPPEGFGDEPKGEPEHAYGDVAVLAYPVPEGAGVAMPASAVSGAGVPLDLAPIGDASLATAATLAGGTPDAPATLTLRYAAPQTIRSATLLLQGATSPFGNPATLPILQAKTADGWRDLAKLPVTGVPATASFAPVTAQEFRVVFGPNTDPGRPSLGDPAPGVAMSLPFADPKAATPLHIADLRLSGEAVIDQFEAKAGFAIARDYYALGTPDAATGIDPGRVIDLTAQMKPDGSLDWTPPPGRWRVVRLGWSLLGTTNHPATAEATGLEVDKYDRDAVHAYLEHYLGMYRDAVGDDLMGAHGLRALLTDSIEVGAANWTPKMIAQFRSLRGYDPTPWLPALTGTLVGTRAQSDAFLYDFRRTLADLISSEHYGEVARVAHEHGLKLYGEALEDLRPSLGDDMTMRSHADVPMAAMWTYAKGGEPRTTLLADMKGAASTAHVYGREFVAAESLTAALSPWAFAPSDLRPMLDLEFASGINRPVIHTSVHQPIDRKPGLSLLIFGQYFTRHETWAEMAKPWVDYIARSSYLLQQGRFVADVAYFYGEEAPLTSLYGNAPVADAPVRYGYDFLNADALLNHVSVKDGAVVTSGGQRYRMIYLGGSSRRMTLAVLRKLAALADAGATIVGEPPERSPRLDDDPAEFAALVSRLWAGKVIASDMVESALATQGVAPDFDYAAEGAPAKLLFVHRATADADIYFVDNREQRDVRVDARFRIAGRTPELWHADSGATDAVSYRTEGGVTQVPLSLGAGESVFVVFRHSAAAPSVTVAEPHWAEAGTLDGPWQLSFPDGRGAPETAQFDTLHSLTEASDPGIRYYSGTTVYARDLRLPKGMKPGEPLLLDLGAVGDVAEVWVNGAKAGTVWHAPWRIDIGKALHKGANRLEIRVADLWVNRLIGDAQPGAKPVTFTTLPTYRADAPLRPAGLLGPVRLLRRAD